MSEKIAEWLDAIQGFRKMIIMLLLVIVGVVFRIENLITGTDFVNLLQGTTVAFMASNSVEHIGSTIKEWIKGQKGTDNTADGAQ
jgi:hypothetical protein